VRPTDPRLLTQLAPARRQLGGVLAAGVASSVLVIGQAFVVTGLVLAALDGDHVVRWAALVAATLAARALVGLLGDV
jgi:ATP-binding cassette subfamily C protein CydCD